jgi:hypothetical protein
LLERVRVRATIGGRMSITIDGELTAPGRYAVRTDGRPVLTLHVHACLGFPFECEIVGDDTPESHQAIERAAEGIARGASCQISGARLRTRTDHGAAANVLSMLDLVVIGGRTLAL